MKKVLIALSLVAISTGAFARPFHGGFHHRPPVYHHHYHHSGWGRGGRGFWPGFVVGVVGGAIVSSFVDSRPVVVTQPAVVTQPVVVQQPVVTQPVVVQQQPVVVQQQPVVVQQPVQQVQQVWVEGRYVDQVQANGSTVRIWQPGHYEQRTVVQ